ncbi:hypothetical protein [Natronosalvus amylolyticus]
MNRRGRFTHNSCRRGGAINGGTLEISVYR